MSHSLRPHGLQSSLSPRVCSNLCPFSQWCHPTISYSFTPFSSYPQSLPASGSFPMSRLFASGGQIIGASALVLLMSILGWFPLGLTGLILRTLESSQCHNSKTSILGAQTWKGKKDMIPGDELWVIKPCLI